MLHRSKPYALAALLIVSAVLFALAVAAGRGAEGGKVEGRAYGTLELDAWREATPAPLGRLEVQGASAEGKLYVFGGYVSWSPFCTTAAAYAYDPAADLWAQLPDMPAPWTHAGVAVDGTDIFLAGGYENAPNCAAGEEATTAVYTYDTLEQVWRDALPPLPEPRGSGALVRLGRTLHFFGGATTARSEPGTAEHWALALDEQGATWSERAPLPNPRSHLSAAVLDGTIYAVGGQHYANERAVHQRSVHRYDPRSDSWEARAELPLTLSHAGSSTLVIDGKLVVIGGEQAHNEHLDTVFVYDPQTDTWTQRPPLPVKANAGVAGHIGDALYFTNGGEFSAKTLRASLVQ